MLIFCKAGLDSYIASAAAAGVNFLTNIPTMFLVDKASHKITVIQMFVLILKFTGVVLFMYVSMCRLVARPCFL